MKTPRIVNALSYIDEELIHGATGRAKMAKKNTWLKWSSLAACFAVMLMAVVITMPTVFNGDETTPPLSTEAIYEKGYFYHIDNGIFSTYIGGQVIEKEKLGDKISDVSVTAGWKNAADEWISTEKLRGEVYHINGIDDDVAVALKFTDKGEAVTTEHYYVIMNPEANLTSVEMYKILPVFQNNTSNEIAGEVLE